MADVESYEQAVEFLFSRAPTKYDELRRNRARFAQAADEARVGKISGAVGTLAHLPIEAEERICSKLGLRAAPISSQVAPLAKAAATIAPALTPVMQCSGIRSRSSTRRTPT